MAKPLQSPKREWGRRLEPLSVKTDKAFKQALKEYATELRIGQGTIVQSLSLRADPELRKRYQAHQRSLHRSASAQKPFSPSPEDLQV